jgi:hypothetical protein
MVLPVNIFLEEEEVVRLAPPPGIVVAQVKTKPSVVVTAVNG